MKLVLGALLAAWLVVGGVAADKRDYFDQHTRSNCSWAATTGLTIAAGPLNYQGVHPRASCQAPEPS